MSERPWTTGTDGTSSPDGVTPAPDGARAASPGGVAPRVAPPGGAAAPTAPADGVAPAAAPPDLVRLLLVASVALITLVAFENLAVSTAMPAVAEDLGGLRLYAVASGVPLAAGLVATAVSGAWSDARGPRGSLLAGIVLFSTGLVIAGLAPSMEILVVGRAVQGFGGGLLVVPLYVLVGAMVPAARQPAFFAAFSAAWVVPALVGPGVTGLVVDHASWRWIFLGVPALTLGVSALLLPLLRHIPPHGSRSDPAVRHSRLLLAATGTGAAVAVLQVAGSQTGSEMAAWVVPAAIVAAAVLVLCLPPLVPAGTVRLLRGVPSAVACRTLLNATFMTAQTFLPLLLVREHGWPVWQAGLVLTVASVAWATGAAIQGRVTSTAGRDRLSWLGPLLLAAGTFITAGATLEAVTPWIVVVGWALGGTGMGLAYPALSVLVLQATPPARHGRISSSLQVADALGAAMGLAASGALFTALVGTGGTDAYLAGLLLASGLGLVASVAGARAAAPVVG
ncbi:MFS transporter [Georgenia subflava]|nr:MFS transporter [Georgenia subflava]